METETRRMKYAYYPGCSLETSAMEYDMSLHAVCEKLGIELIELEDWCCCGATSAHMTDELLSVSLPAENEFHASGPSAAENERLVK